MRRGLLVGCGNMGSALKSGWNQCNCVERVTIVSPHEKASINVLLRPQDEFRTDPGKVDASDPFDVAVLAIKPQIMAGALPAYRSLINDVTLTISTAAGKGTGFIRESLALGKDAPVVRVMPNTPCSIGEGVIGCYADTNVAEDKRQQVEALFAPMGKVFWVKDEMRMHAVTAVSGSGPGFVFAHMEELEAGGMTRDEAIADVLEALEPASEAKSMGFLNGFKQAAVDEGFEPVLAETIVRQTIKGSALLAAARKDKSFAELRQAVTSPNGTTAAGLTKWKMEQNSNMCKRMHETVHAACNRSMELAAPG